MALRLISSLGAETYTRLVEIWGSAVTATHHFLAPEHYAYFEDSLPGYFPNLELTGAHVDGHLVGYSATTPSSLEMLFVHADSRGQGVGTALLGEALNRYPDLKLAVNEQNPDARKFYERHGFAITHRDDVDGFGFPYPILHMARRP